MGKKPLQLSLLLICSSMLVIMSSWSLNTFVRLKKARKTYQSDDAFEDAVGMSKTYTSGGLIIGIIMLVVSIGLSVFSAISIYRKK